MNTKSFLGNLAKCLKPEGRLVIIDWDPVKLHQTSKQEFDSELRQTLRRLQYADFEVLRTLDFLPRQRIWICKHATGRVHSMWAALHLRTFGNAARRVPSLGAKHRNSLFLAGEHGWDLPLPPFEFLDVEPHRTVQFR